MLLATSDEATPYGYIDTVQVGNHTVSPLQLPATDLLIIGADGHRECGNSYQQLLGKTPAVAYAPLYGSFPTSVGFDLAVAAVSLQDDNVYPLPDTTGPTSVAPQKLKEQQGVTCLKFGGGGDYGMIRLSR